jgi:hypothetical protein
VGGVIALAVLLGFGCVMSAVAQKTVQPSALLAGVIDVHTHSAPDSMPRAIDVVDLARIARDSGMRGLVIKDHFVQTASTAFIVRKIVPGIELFGGITLDSTNGGLNLAAVENMANMTGGWGRVVWMPTFDSEASARFGAQASPRAAVRISDGTTLLPGVKDIIGLISQRQLVLATGHSSATEHLMLVREGAARGLQRHMIVTHAPNTPGGMSVEQMQQAARAGAFIEFCYLPLISQTSRMTASEYAKAIRAIGPDSVIMSTDLGQAGNPLHTDGMEDFIRRLMKEGFTQGEIDLMTKANPATLLRLPVK